MAGDPEIEELLQQTRGGGGARPPTYDEQQRGQDPEIEALLNETRATPPKVDASPQLNGNADALKKKPVGAPSAQDSLARRFLNQLGKLNPPVDPSYPQPEPQGPEFALSPADDKFARAAKVNQRSDPSGALGNAGFGLTAPPSTGEVGTGLGLAAALALSEGTAALPLLARMGLQAGTAGAISKAFPPDDGRSATEQAAGAAGGEAIAAGLNMLPGPYKAAAYAGLGGLSLAGLASDDPATMLAAGGAAAIPGFFAGKLMQPRFVADQLGAKAAKMVEEGGGVLSPSLQSQSKPAKLLENFAESTWLGSGPMQRSRQKAVDIVTERVNQALQAGKGNASKEVAGGMVNDAISGGAQTFKEQAAQLYKKPDELFEKAIQDRVRAQGAIVPAGSKVTYEPTVSLRDARGIARLMLKQQKQGLPDAEVTGFLREINDKPNSVSFEAAARLRSDLIRKGSKGQALISRGDAKKMTAAIDAAMEKSAREAGPEVYAAWRQANEFYRQGATRFNSKLVQQLQRTNPDAVVDAITRPNRPFTIRQARDAIGDPRVWREVEGQFLERLANKAMENHGDAARGTMLSGKMLRTQLKNFGETALNEMIGPERAKQLSELAQILERTQQRSGSGAGGVGVRSGAELVAIGGGMGGALPALLMGRPGVAAGTAAGSAALPITGGLLGRAFSNPRVVKYLMEGLKVPPGVANYEAQINRFAGQISQEMARERSREKRDSRGPRGRGASATFGGPRVSP